MHFVRYANMIHLHILIQTFVVVVIFLFLYIFSSLFKEGVFNLEVKVKNQYDTDFEG